MKLLARLAKHDDLRHAHRLMLPLQLFVRAYTQLDGQIIGQNFRDITESLDTKLCFALSRVAWPCIRVLLTSSCSVPVREVLLSWVGQHEHMASGDGIGMHPCPHFVRVSSAAAAAAN